MTAPARSSSVTELALLSLPSPSSEIDGSPLTPRLKGALNGARVAMERVSGLPFAYIYCAAQNQVFIVGGWPSVKFHMEEWIPSTENQALVKNLGELGVGVKWMWHVGVGRGVVERAVLGGWERGEKRVRIWRSAVARESVAEVKRVLGIGEDGAGEDAREVAGGVRLDEGFMAGGESEKSLRSEEQGWDEVVVLARLDGLGRSTEEVEKILNQAQSLVEKWEVSDGVVVDV